MLERDVFSEKQELRRNISAAGEALGIDEYECQEPLRTKDCDRFGICAGCTSFMYVEYEFSGDMAFCRDWDKRLQGVQRIMKCSRYEKRGSLSLSQMVEIATLIDPAKKDRVGLV